MVKKIEKFLEKYWYWVLLVIFLFSVILRLGYLLYRGQYTRWEGDEGFFGQIAGNMVQGLGYTYKGHLYPSRMPLLTLMTAAYSWCVGFSVAKAHVFGVLLGALIPLAAMVCSRLVTRSVFVALLTGLYTMVYPFFIHEASYLDTENLFIPLFLLYFAVLYQLEHKATFKGYFFAGILLGLSVLTRPTLSIFLGFYGVYLLIKKWPLQQIVFNIFIQGLCLACLLAPWSWVLSYDTGKLCFLTRGTNAAMIGGTNPVVIRDPAAAGEWINLGRDFPEVEQEISNLAGPQASELQQVLAVIRTYPLDMPLLMLNKLKKLWGYSPKHYTNRNFRDDLIGFLSYGWLLPFLLIVLAERKFPATDLFWLFAVYFSFMTLLTSGTMRFRLPLDAIIIMMIVWYFAQQKGKTHV